MLTKSFQTSKVIETILALRGDKFDTNRTTILAEYVKLIRC